MNEKNTYTRVDWISVASDEEAKKNGEAVKVKVTFVYKDFTTDDLLDRLTVSNSPKVSVQAVLRKMKEIPKEYTYNVPKAGTRAEVSIDDQIARMSAEERDALIARLTAKK